MPERYAVGMKGASHCRRYARCGVLRSRSRHRALAWLGIPLLLLALLPLPIQAASTVSVDSIRLGEVELRSLQLSLSTDQGTQALRLQVAAIDAYGLQWRDLEWRCPLVAAEAGWNCGGALRLAGHDAGQLQLDWGPKLQLRWQERRSSFKLEQGATDAPLQMQWRSLPLTWLQPVLGRLLPQLRLQAGDLSGQADIALDRQVSRFALQAQNIDIDSADGLTAMAGVSADWRGSLSLLAAPGPSLQLQGKVSSGELLLGPFYAQLASGSDMQIDLAQAATDRWQLKAFHWRDPEGLALQASAEIDLQQTDWLQRAQVKLDVKDLRRSWPRYAAALADWLGLGPWQLAGAATLESGFAAGEAEQITLDLRGAELRRNGEGLTLQGLNGGLAWQRHGSAPAQTMRWESIAIGADPLGSGTLVTESEAGAIRLAEPFNLEWLGGKIGLLAARFDLLTSSWEAAIEVDHVDLRQLTDKLGWPALDGQLSGRLPRLRYVAPLLSIDGGLQAQLLGGQLTVEALSMERPFGVAPTLSTDLRFDNIELAPLTRAFGFGEISGWLDGEVLGLRMVNWAPTAFAARLSTDPAFPGKQRISQKAVNDLSSVGGGAIAGLQNQVLKFFDTFAYRRILLSCRLENNVCQMGGMDSSGNGYTVVEGAGLPRITVNGFQRRVDWPVLLARLKAATRGQGPRIDG